MSDAQDTDHEVQIVLTEKDAQWFVGWLGQLLGPLELGDVNADSIRISEIRKKIKEALGEDTDVE